MTTLNRAHYGRTVAPIRILHLGLGNFTRAHQAWYTEKAPDNSQWGIAAFTGRSPKMADLLNPQQGLYSLVTKGADGDSVEVISSISRVHAASDLSALAEYFSSPDLAIVTTTVTEAGYYRRADGSLDVTHPLVAADLDALRGLAAGDGTLGVDTAAAGTNVADLSGLELNTAPCRVLLGLLVRKAAEDFPLTILPCDNLSENGAAFRQVVMDAAQAVAPDAIQWIENAVSWATCMVDRITPATTQADIDAVAALGYDDASPVPTEPFSEWVISGNFPAGRPDWEAAGVTFVEDVAPYEERKLRMLNGSHSLMAYAGSICGAETVADAFANPLVREWVNEWWADAGATLSVEWADYTQALSQRYSNPNIRHLLAQIAADGSLKLGVRAIPLLRIYRTKGEIPRGVVRLMGAWIAHLRGHGAPVSDANAETILALVGGNLDSDTRAILAYFDEELAADSDLVEAVTAAAQEMCRYAK
ncbi:MAG: mannitol dehydrogenase family protein [Actinomycetaceae bacterium]|nr:mannitol dehydrogenase family protein [Actinomycetaceae bacterium]